MNDKKKILKAIRFIEDTGVGASYVNLAETIWKDFDRDEQIRLRRLLLLNKLIRLKDDDQWAFQVTAEAILAKEDEFDDSGILKTDRELKKQLKVAARGAIVGALIAGLIQPFPILIQKVFPDRQKPEILLLPKIQIVHDTIYFQKPNPKKN